jgi:hypothetical protein
MQGGHSCVFAVGVVKKAKLIKMMKKAKGFSGRII